MMTLYSYWRSSAAYRVRIALNLKGLDYEVATVNLLADEKEKQTYRQLNPQGLVPMLVDDDVTITQSTAIVEYLEERYADPALLPTDEQSRAEVRSLCQIVACDIHPLNNLRVLNYLKSEFSADQDRVDDWYRHWIASGFEAIEQKLKVTRGEYAMGNDISLADVYLVPQVYNARRFQCDLSPFANIVDVTGRLEQIPAFIDAAPENQLDAPN